MFCPQHGDRIMTIGSVTSFHRLWPRASAFLINAGRHRRRSMQLTLRCFCIRRELSTVQINDVKRCLADVFTRATLG